jgi:hypothetical protein
MLLNGEASFDKFGDDQTDLTSRALSRHFVFLESR